MLSMTLLSLSLHAGLSLQAGALAAEPSALLKLVSEGPKPEMVIRCAPLGIISAGADAMASLPMPLGEVKKALDPMSSAAMRAAGFDLDAPVSLVAWQVDGAEVLSATIPFRGDAASAEGWLTSLGTPLEPQGAGVWGVGKKGAQLVLNDGALRLQRGVAPKGTWTPPAGLLDGIPDEGCAALLFNPGDEELKNLVAVALYGAPADLRGSSEGLSTLRGRMLLAKDAPAMVQTTKRGRPKLGRSKQPPLAVLSLGLPLSDLIEGVAAMETLPGKMAELRAPLSAVGVALEQAGVQITEGTSVAVWRNVGLLRQGPRVSFAAIVPVRTAKGGHIPARRLEDGIEAALAGRGMTVSRQDGALMVPMGDKTFAVSARRDRLYLASSPELLDETTACLRGERWADRDFQNFAADWGLAVQSSSKEANGRLGVGARGPLVEFVLEASGGGLGGSTAMLTTMALSRLGNQLDDLFEHVGEEVGEEVGAEPAPLEPAPLEESVPVQE